MKKHIGVLNSIVLSTLLIMTSCRTKSLVSSSSVVQNQGQNFSVISDEEDEALTTTTEEESVPTNVSSLDENEITLDDSTIQTDTPFPNIPSSITLADLDYWSKADSFRILHTQSPPFKAVTLKKGTEEYNTLLSLLQQVKGTYLGISHEGLAGGFMPIYVYQGVTELDRITIDVHGEARFSTDIQQENSRYGSVNTYASLYTISEKLSEEIKAFFEMLEYTEDI